MRVLLIGSGGREHAIAWKLLQSPRLTRLFVAPGNAGTAQIAENVDLRVPPGTASAAEIAAYLEAAVRLAHHRNVDLAFVAPDDPLAWGLVDALEAAGVAAFGPSRAAARLEASKSWAKDLMQRHGVPHTPTTSFDDIEAAKAYVRAFRGAVVVKADGLAVGKGAIVTSTAEEALTAIDELRTLGEAGKRLTIEPRVVAREVSAHSFSDGRSIAAMPLSCDHKAVFDGNRGPNTGGMGVYSPPWWASPSLSDEITRKVLERLVRGMADEGTPFRGVVYPGLFVTDAGLQVFECNARFGDPETQALLVRLESDLLEIVVACVEGKLSQMPLAWSDRPSVVVVMASRGYPGAYSAGVPIHGLDAVDSDVVVFHAGTRRREDGEIVTAGGRVLGVTATGSTLEAARTKAYENVARISFEGAHYRRDIGLYESSALGRD
jgi:phosphoribosylamine---glycine ligase